MRRLAAFIGACVGLAGVAQATPSEETVQGIYEGTCNDATGLRKLEARVVACGPVRPPVLGGGGTYKVFIRQPLAGGAVAGTELDGKTEGDTVRFSGRARDVEWTGAWTGAAVRLAGSGGAAIEMKRVVRESPTLGAKPPAGAIVLLDGRNFDEVARKPSKEGARQEWKIVEGDAVEAPAGGITSKRQFDGSLKLHVEFKVPLMPGSRDQDRGNSGVFLPNGDEIQVLDSFGMATYTGGGCGGLYRYKDPDAFDGFSLASLPPLQWQTYDIEYRARKQDGKPAGALRITVFHNGIRIHDNYELRGGARAGPILLQDHGCPVRYRNVWVLPMEDEKGVASAPAPALAPQKADLLVGQWAGTWSSSSNGMGDSLCCNVSKSGDGKYEAVFEAVFGKIFTHRSTVTLSVEADGDTWRFRGEKDLGLLSGGVYRYEGRTDGQEFYSTYDSLLDKGVFRMKRVGAAGEAAAAQPASGGP